MVSHASMLLHTVPQYLYDPSLSTGSANQCILGNWYLRHHLLLLCQGLLVMHHIFCHLFLHVRRARWRAATNCHDKCCISLNTHNNTHNAPEPSCMVDSWTECSISPLSARGIGPGCTLISNSILLPEALLQALDATKLG